MKILFVGPSSDFTKQIVETLEVQGHKVVYIDERSDYTLPSVFRPSRILWRFSRRIPWWRRGASRALQKVVLSHARNGNFDLLLSNKGTSIKPSTLKTLRDIGIKTAAWFPDNAANEPYRTWVRERGPLWDRLLSFDSAIYEQIPKEFHGQVHVLPFAVDPEAYDPRPITDEDRKRFGCDVCFVGAPYPERVRLLQSIESDVDLKVWGWSGWRNKPLAHRWGGSLNAKESAKAYCLSKICVNTNILPLAKGANVKTFEICAAGGFQLTDEPADLSDSFTVGEELDVFHNREEFCSKVKYWLDNDEGRRKVANAGYQRVIKEHTMLSRVRELLDISMS
jgi:spore maturation protein CgeB